MLKSKKKKKKPLTATLIPLMRPCEFINKRTFYKEFLPSMIPNFTSDDAIFNFLSIHWYFLFSIGHSKMRD